MYGTLIQTVTVGAGGAASIDFTSIPQTYTDLVLVFSSRSNYANTETPTLLEFNGNGDDPGAVYRQLLGFGTSVSSTNGTYQYIGYYQGDSTTANSFGSVQVYLPNYTGSAAKTASVDGVIESNTASVRMTMNAVKFSLTAAITSIKLRYSGYNFNQYSTASLYGITKGSGGATVS